MEKALPKHEFHRICIPVSPHLHEVPEGGTHAATSTTTKGGLNQTVSVTSPMSATPSSPVPPSSWPWSTC